MERKVSKVEEVMNLTIKVIKVGNTENIQLFRGEEYVGLDNLSEYEGEILNDIVTEVNRDAQKRKEEKKAEEFEKYYKELEGDIALIYQALGVTYSRGTHTVDIKGNTAIFTVSSKIPSRVIRDRGVADMLASHGWAMDGFMTHGFVDNTIVKQINVDWTGK